MSPLLSHRRFSIWAVQLLAIMFVGCGEVRNQSQNLETAPDAVIARLEVSKSSEIFHKNARAFLFEKAEDKQKLGMRDSLFVGQLGSAVLQFEEAFGGARILLYENTVVTLSLGGPTQKSPVLLVKRGRIKVIKVPALKSKPLETSLLLSVVNQDQIIEVPITDVDRDVFANPSLPHAAPEIAAAPPEPLPAVIDSIPKQIAREPAQIPSPAPKLPVLEEAPQEAAPVEAKAPEEKLPWSAPLNNIRFGIAVLQNSNSDTDLTRTQGGFSIGAEMLQSKHWGLKVLTRSSVKEFSGAHELPFWTAWHGQWHLDEGFHLGSVRVRPTFNLGFEAYFNRGVDSPQQFVKQYLGPSTGLDLQFLFGTLDRYEANAETLYTWFENGSKLFVSGSAYYNFEKSPWSIGGGLWIDALRLQTQFQETFTSIETNVRYKY
jgi:hypothetical protein